TGSVLSSFVQQETDDLVRRRLVDTEAWETVFQKPVEDGAIARVVDGENFVWYEIADRTYNGDSRKCFAMRSASAGQQANDEAYCDSVGLVRNLEMELVTFSLSVPVDFDSPNQRVR
ncbi:MAG: hypothetical protein AAF658_20255, partial [Myxococcota bacterium]